MTRLLSSPRHGSRPPQQQGTELWDFVRANMGDLGRHWHSSLGEWTAGQCPAIGDGDEVHIWVTDQNENGRRRDATMQKGKVPVYNPTEGVDVLVVMTLWKAFLGTSRRGGPEG